MLTSIEEPRSLDSFDGFLCLLVVCVERSFGKGFLWMLWFLELFRILGMFSMIGCMCKLEGKSRIGYALVLLQRVMFTIAAQAHSQVVFF